MIVSGYVSIVGTRLGKDRVMSNWVVKLKSDDNTYPRVIVSANSSSEAMQIACNIELAPLRSVISVTELRG